MNEGKSVPLLEERRRQILPEDGLQDGLHREPDPEEEDKEMIEGE
jgi:hypothetical protein